MEHQINDSTKIEILVVGWIRELFASKQFAALEISPHLTQIFVVWYSPEIEWRFKTEFSETQCIGYLADSGEVIKGQVVMTTQNEDGVTVKVFIHFENDGSHQNSKGYGWFGVPNDRFCPLPMVRPKPRVPNTDVFFGQSR